MDNSHQYADSVYSSELEITDTTESSMSASFLDILLQRDINSKLTAQLYDKRDGFNTVNIPYLLCEIPLSPAHGLYVLQFLR